MNLKGVFLSNRQDWRTPKHIIRQLTAEFGPLFDPCPPDPTFDGLKIDWVSVSFVNPPFDKIALWCEKAFNECMKGVTVYLLIPARTDTKYFHKWVLPMAKEIRFYQGRLKFDDGLKGATFPSIGILMKE
tara:strand:+ start:578 stop:967 length:390 start_codon:yes stop_codon:yes gene_type:complete